LFLWLTLSRYRTSAPADDAKPALRTSGSRFHFDLPSSTAVTVETINTIAQLVAAVGVIASLFYLAAQIRQNTRSMRAIAVDALAHSMVDLLAVQGPELTRSFALVTEDWNGAGEEDRLRALPFLFATFKLFENAWFQQRQGMLNAEQWQGWDAYIRTYYHRPGVRTWWSMRRPAFAVGFAKYLESTLPISEMTPLKELIKSAP
jgi:hypothetical protein